MSGFANIEERESCMNSLRYREVVISFHNKTYHIEAYNNKYVVGLFKKKEYEIEKRIEFSGKNEEDAFNKLMCEKIFDGRALKDIIDEIEWLES